MIPPVILLGLLFGVGLGHRGRFVPLVLAGIVTSMAWGAVVADDPTSFVIDAAR